jgi:hypothetical protein
VLLHYLKKSKVVCRQLGDLILPKNIAQASSAIGIFLAEEMPFGTG